MQRKFIKTGKYRVYIRALMDAIERASDLLKGHLPLFFFKVLEYFTNLDSMPMGFPWSVFEK